MTRISRDPRNALRLSEDDRRKNNTVIPVLLFFPCHSRVLFFSSVIPVLARESKRDVQLKAGHDKEKEAEHDIEKALSFERAGKSRKLTFLLKPISFCRQKQTYSCEIP